MMTSKQNTFMVANALIFCTSLANATERYIWSDKAGFQPADGCEMRDADSTAFPELRPLILKITTAPSVRATHRAAGTYWQLAAVQNRFLNLDCGGRSYALFNAYSVKSDFPVFQVGVRREEIKILASAQTLTVGQAAVSAAEDRRQGAAVAAAQSQPEQQPAEFNLAAAAKTSTQMFKLVKTEPVEQPSPAAAPSSTADSDLAAINRAAPWNQVRDSMAWTRAVLDVVRAHKSGLDKARDVETFCQGYHKASARQQEICWIRIIGGVMKFESSFKPGDKMRENDGQWSVGLLAMSPAQCPNAPSISALMDPIRNLTCGAEKFANLVISTGWISGPGHRGAAQNWSTLRDRYTVFLRSSGKRVTVGHKKEVIAIANQFTNFG
jgi:hypothetical protein